MTQVKGLAAWLGVLVCTGVLVLPGKAPGQGIILPGGGPIMISMGGVSTGAPLDSMGAQYWNPAGIAGLKRSQVDIGGQLAYPDIHVGSTLPAGSIAPGFPAVGAAG